jgi:hypothetical protein
MKSNASDVRASAIIWELLIAIMPAFCADSQIRSRSSALG